MKCVVGIDIERRCASAIGLLARLRFPNLETQLLHVEGTLQLSLPYSAYGMFVETDQIYETLHAVGEEILAESQKEAKGLNLDCSTELSEGFPIQSLLDTADETGADLIAITSTARSTLGAVFGGSVARGLAIAGKHSVLVAREAPASEGPLRAVFATNQSPFCDECIKLLAQWAPKGLSHITLLTVHEKEKHHGILSRLHGVDASAAVEQADQTLTAKGEATAKWLTEQGIPAEFKIVDGEIEEAIHHTMQEDNAELLIVGSQGHGFVERVMVGSTALHEIISEQFPVLLLRPAVAP